jgi:O-methyltransferase involved in polyketide biosynthesis
VTGLLGGPESAAEHDPPDEPLVPRDAARPSIARAYDCLLGGKDHFPPDRELAERLVALYPGVRQMARHNRRFLVRALDYVLAQAISQYADLGAGLPTSPAVHEIVRRHAINGNVVYVDNDLVVINHLRAMAAGGDDHIDAVAGDLVKAAAVMDAVQATGLIDLDKPVCLIAAMVLHFLDAPTAREVTAAYVSELAPGSHVIITVGCGEPAAGLNTGAADQITRTYNAAPVFNHTPADVASFFTGLDLIKPGIADARAWMPGWRTPAPFAERPGQVLAGIGVKP